MAKILIAEDDDAVMFGLVQALQAASHIVEAVESGKEALDRLRLYQYDLAVLDWGLPVLTGIEICKQYRASKGTMPILILTGKAAEENKEEGLDSGADDYLTKPFSMKEFLARIRALLRRPNVPINIILQSHGLLMNTSRCSVSRGEIEISLLPKEFALLEYFMRNKNQVFDVTALLDRVWSSESDASEDAVRQCLMRLRKKVDIAGQESIIKTVKGMGYVLEDSSV